MKHLLHALCAFLLAFCATPRAQAQYQWNNLAGQQSSFGSNDGPADFAQFNNAVAVATDASGNVYVADGLTIRKISTDRIVSTLAGNPNASGFTDGTGSAARFSGASGVAVDGAGNVYVADQSNSTIRKITSAGVVTTLAGTPGVTGNADGTGNAAQFYYPTAIAVDVSGDNIYVAQSYNHTIRKVTSAGVVTTLAGTPGVAGSADGNGSAALFNKPQGLAVDGSGNVYVADTNNGLIRKITSGGEVTTLAAVGTVGYPGLVGVAVGGNGVIYVADSYSIRNVTSEGVVTTFFGTPGQYTGYYSFPSGLAVDGNGNVYIANSYSVVKVSSTGVFSEYASHETAQGDQDGTGVAARFNGPVGIAADDLGNAYVADVFNNRLRKVTSAGVVTTLLGGFNQPYGLARDGAGNLYVADTENNIVRKVSTGGVVTTLAGGFNKPQAVAVDASGNVYVADTNNHAIRKIASGGGVSILAGTPGLSGTANGTGGEARFNSPMGVAVDGFGNVYVADTYNNCIRKITSSGVVTTLAGRVGYQNAGYADGIGTAAEFIGPYGLTVDGSGNLYVADGNNTIRKVTTGGVVTTIGGVPYVSLGTDGLGSEAGFYSPGGIVRTKDGVLLVADSLNNRITRGVAAYTEPPALLTPATNAITKAPVSVLFTLPDDAFPGSVTLTIDATVFTLAASQETAGIHSFTIDPANPLASPAIASGASAPIADGIHALTLSYRNVHGTPAATAGTSNVLLDTLAPVLSLPANITVPATGAGGAMVTYSASASDVGSGVATSSFLPASGGTFPIGTTTVTASATDVAGNTVTSTFTITVLATPPPTLIAPTIGAITKAPVSVSFTLPEAALPGSVTLSFGSTVLTLAASQETAGPHSFTFDPANPAASPAIGSGAAIADGVYTVTLRYQNTLGSPAAAALASNVRIDTTPPVLTLPANISVPATSGAGAVVTYDASASDVGSGVATSSFLPASGGTFPSGVTTVSASATDVAGNTVTGSFTITVGTLPPVLIAPATGAITKAPVSVLFTLPQAAQPGSVTLSFGATVLTLATSQEGAGAHSFTFDPANPTASPAIASGIAIADGVHTVTLRYQNTLGSPAATAVSSNVRLDTTPPVLTLPANISVPATSGAGAVVTYDASASDLGSGVATSSFLPASGGTFPSGVTTVSASATDVAGNTVTGSFTVTVIPSTNANLASLSLSGVVLQPAFDAAVTSYSAIVANSKTTTTVTAAAADAGASVHVSPANPAALAVGNNVIDVGVLAQDGTTAKTYRVTVKRTVPDKTKPAITISAPAGTAVTGPFTLSGTINEAVYLSSVTVRLNGGAPVAADFTGNSGAAIPWSLAGIQPENGPNTLVVTATDLNGNAGTLTKIVTYLDPSLTMLAGTYDALIIPVVTPTADITGLITVQVAAGGAFTGQVSLGGVRVGFSGLLATGGVAHFKPTLGATFDLIDRTDFENYLGALSLSVTEGDGLVGTLSTKAAGGTLLATFAGKRAPYSKTHLLTVADGPFLNLPASSPNRGRYNVVFRTPAPASETYPAGDGYATVTIASNGKVAVAGSLADGTKFKSVARLREDGTAALLSSLYRKRGVLAGELVFAADTDTDVVGANFRWLRPALPRARYYPEGWPDGLEMTVFGTHYAGAASVNIGQGGSNPGAGNAALVFSDGVLDVPLHNPVSIDASTGKVKLVLAVGPVTKLSLNVVSGLFAGTINRSGETDLYRGVLLNKGINRGGFGYFLSVPPLAYDASGESGKVFLDPSGP